MQNSELYGMGYSILNKVQWYFTWLVLEYSPRGIQIQFVLHENILV